MFCMTRLCGLAWSREQVPGQAGRPACHCVAFRRWRRRSWHWSAVWANRGRDACRLEAGNVVPRTVCAFELAVAEPTRAGGHRRSRPL